MTPVTFPQANAVFAKDQPQYLSLPAYRDPSAFGDGMVVSCWQLTWRERFKVLFGGKLWLSQLTFGRPLQPQRPMAESPFPEARFRA